MSRKIRSCGALNASSLSRLWLAGLMLLGAGFLPGCGIVSEAAPLPGLNSRPSARPAPGGKLWFLGVGVSHYRYASDLPFSRTDAEALAEAFSTRDHGHPFQQVRTRVLVDEQATREGILDAMNSFFAGAAPDDTAMVVLIGHGGVIRDTFYFAPYAANPDDFSSLASDGLAAPQLEAALLKVSSKAKRTILVLDACRSGAFHFSEKAVTTSAPGGKSLESRLPARASQVYILASSGEDEDASQSIYYTLADQTEGHSAMGLALLRGLSREAEPQRNEQAAMIDLLTYASLQVPRITTNLQHPEFHGPELDRAVTYDTGSAPSGVEF